MIENDRWEIAKEALNETIARWTEKGAQQTTVLPQSEMDFQAA